MKTRREFLLLAGASVAATACGDRWGGSDRIGKGNAGALSWHNPLRIPPIDDGEVAAGVRRFELVAREGTSQFLDGRAAPTWGYNGSYLGPTLRAAPGDEVEVTVRNQLSETTTVHWHGMKLPAAMDGGPHQPIEPGATWRPSWTIDQPAATLWYHPHPHGETAAHVYRGLAGLWILDDQDSALPDRYGIDDIPVVIQDRDIAEDGSLREDRTVAFWGLMGSDILVNGTHDPHFEVTTRFVRLRILNGSNARTYNLGFGDARSFQVVANDCGLLPTSVLANAVTLSPAERVEIIVEVEPGAPTVLTSRSGNRMIDDGDFDILQLRPSPDLDDNGPLPETHDGAHAVQLPPAPTRRSFTLAGDGRINGKSMDLTRVDEVVPSGSIEEWRVWAPGVPHNFHIHNAAFTVLDIDGRAPAPEAAGLKDTVFVPAGSTARLAVGFGDHPDPDTPFMFHCHILRHEDEGMMGQFTIVPTRDLDAAPRRIELPRHHGHD